MEREELLSKINEKLGSTKLSLSEKTMNDFADEMLIGITDDAELSDELLERKVSFLKSLDGNLHYDVSKQVEEYKKNYKPLNKVKVDDNDNSGGGDELRQKIVELEKRYNEIEERRKSDAEARNKESLVSSAVDIMKDKFKMSDVGVNNYILKQTLRDVVINGDEKPSDIAEAIEESYFKNLKEAGIEYGLPTDGNQAIRNNNAADAKSRREALKNELISRGYIPKKKD